MTERMIVCGGRDFNDRARAWYVLGRFTCDDTVIVHGAADGADTLARQWAQFYQRGEWAFPADWNKHGRSAGPIRNRQMLKESTPQCVLAFPGGRGTADMMKIARDAGVGVAPVADLEFVWFKR